MEAPEAAVATSHLTPQRARASGIWQVPTVRESRKSRALTRNVSPAVSSRCSSPAESIVSAWPSDASDADMDVATTPPRPAGA